MPTGKCSLRGGVKVIFPRSGVGVVPYEVSTHDGMNDWRRMRSEVSLQAGRLIVEEVEENEPAYLEAGGNIINRYIYKGDSVELQDDRAQLNLEDVIKQYEDINVSTDFDDSYTLEDVVVQLFEIADDNLDTYGAVTGVETDPNTLQTTVDYQTNLELLTSFDLVGLWNENNGGYDWNEESIIDALNEIAKDHSLDYTTTRGGKFVMGNNVFTKPKDNSMHRLTGDTQVDMMRLREYNVSRTGKKVQTTAKIGPPITGEDLDNLIRSNVDFDSIPHERDGYETRAQLQPVAYVHVPGIEGKQKAPERMSTKSSMGRVAGAAVQDLFNSWGGFTNGNIVFNAGTSTREGQQRLTHSDPGDIIEVVGNAAQSEQAQDDDASTFQEGGDSLCNQLVYSGLFSVKTVKHKLNDRVGWETMWEVSLLPPEYEMSTQWVDKAEHGVYRDLEQFVWNTSTDDDVKVHN